MKYKYDLEMSILSCMLQKPKLIEETILEDKHFTRHQRVWKFMKSIYEKYKCFDLVLMYNVCKNKYQLVEYMEWLVEMEVTTANFRKYEQELIKEYEETKKDKYIREKAFELANDLYTRMITAEVFKKRIEEVYSNAEEMFKGKE